MARKPDSTAPVVIAMDEPDTSDLRIIGGSRSDKFNSTLIDTMVKTGWFPPGIADEDRRRQMFVAVKGLQAFKPADEIEGMIAAQAMAAHHASMECSRRAMLHEQPFEAAQGFRKAAANASRTFIELLAALDRRRKGGQQVVRVEHIHIHSGANAVVGNIAAPAIGGGGDVGKNQGEPRTSPSRLAHDTSLGAVLPPLRSDPEREVVPVARDEELPVPDARRKQHRANGGRN